MGQGGEIRRPQAGLTQSLTFHTRPFREWRILRRRGDQLASPNDRCWHFSAVPTAPSNVGYRG
jgi:hypothetical protein